MVIIFEEWNFFLVKCVGMICLFDLQLPFSSILLIRLLLFQTGGAFQSSEACTGSVDQNPTFRCISCSNRRWTLVSATLYIDNNTSWTGQSHHLHISLLLSFFSQRLARLSRWIYRNCLQYLKFVHAAEWQAFMLKRAAEEPLGHAAAIIADVLENAESNRVIDASQKRALLQEMAIRLS